MKTSTLALITAMLVSQTSLPAQTETLLPSLQPVLNRALGEFDEIPAERRAVLEDAAHHVSQTLKAGSPARLNFICTHNSRRSQMAQVWAQVAALHYQLQGVECYSGGTETTACNIRTINALRRAGFAIAEPAPAANPTYDVHFAVPTPPLRLYSKHYLDKPNPADEFAAFMCCGHADASCPLVDGAEARFSINYDDPKEADGTPEEAARYDERCRQIAREMLFLMSKVRQAVP